MQRRKESVEKPRKRDSRKGAEAHRTKVRERKEEERICNSL
jgi:hypothetical protein